MTLWGRLHIGPTFQMVAAPRPSELRSSGISRWTRHSLGIMVMPLPALCVFQQRSFSLHPCCVCVWELFFDISWGKWLIYSLGGLSSHTYEVLERCDFSNPWAFTIWNLTCSKMQNWLAWWTQDGRAVIVVPFHHSLCWFHHVHLVMFFHYWIILQMQVHCCATGNPKIKIWWFHYVHLFMFSYFCKVTVHLQYGSMGRYHHEFVML